MCITIFRVTSPLPASSTSKTLVSGCYTAKCDDDVRFSVHYIFLPVRCLLCRHCWMQFNQAQWRGGGWFLRPGTVMYWHCQGLGAGMHATGWHSSLIQCCCHMESILLQQYRFIQRPILENSNAKDLFFVNDLVINAHEKIST